MEVDRTAYASMLPSLLKVISKAHFIAFDLELSGIPTQRRRDGKGKQTLQERYTEVKCAAETFHILQIGLTCVEEDRENGRYTTRSFNFNLSPLVSDGIDIERTFSYSTGAVDFLLGHGYRMDAPFSSGIPYLTKSETELAKQRAGQRIDKAAIPDLQIRPDDADALAFMQRARDEIKLWKTTGEPVPEFHNIAGKAAPTNNDPDNKMPLSRFHKRLTHQLVRAEFPEFQTFSRPNFVQVQHYNQEEQDLLKETSQSRIAHSIFNQIGFRWIADAMAGGDLAGFEPTACERHIRGEPEPVNSKAFARRINEFIDASKQRRKVLVGHNCFMDLVFFYRYFCGDLPENVEEFQEMIHGVFPLIIDTKYMATMGIDGEKFRGSQLWQIAESLAGQASPCIDTNGDHPAYPANQQYHEAGFDSFVTAKVLLKLAAKLAAQSASPPPETTLSATDGVNTVETRKKKKPKKSRSMPADELTAGKFFHTNMFETLLETSENSNDGDLAETPASSSSTVRPDATETHVVGLETLRIQDASQGSVTARNMIPPFDTDFWQIYGNRLRCYGTIEEVCKVGSKETNQEEVGSPDEPKAEVKSSGDVVRKSWLASSLDRVRRVLI